MTSTYRRTSVQPTTKCCPEPTATPAAAPAPRHRRAAHPNNNPHSNVEETKGLSKNKQADDTIILRIPYCVSAPDAEYAIRNTLGSLFLRESRSVECRVSSAAASRGTRHSP